MRSEYLLHVRKGARVYVSENVQQQGSLTVTGTYVGGQYGEIIWNLSNGTDKVQYVGLVRGAVLNINGQQVIIPDYLFGRAFAEVYFTQGVSQFGTSPDDFAQPYTLAVYNDKTIGFVFRLEPGKTLQVPEYGFIGLVSYNARLVPVQFGNAKMFIDIYDYQEVLQYETQTGLNLGYVPDPIAFYSIVVKAPEDQLGYVFHERVLLPVPQQWTSLANKIIGFFKSIFSSIPPCWSISQ